MEQFFEYVKMALANIQGNKSRSILTMLGIIIGISSVILVITVGEGVQETMSHDLNNMIGGQMAIYENPERSSNTEKLNQEDLNAVKETKGVKLASPYLSGTGTIHSYKGDYLTKLTGYNEHVATLEAMEITKGTAFTARQIECAEPVMILSEKSAKKLYGTTDVVGMEVEVETEGSIFELTIVGVGNSKQMSSFVSAMLGQESDLSVYLPYTMFEKFGNSAEVFESIYFMAEEASDEPEIGQIVLAKINKNHPDTEEKEPFSLEMATSALEQIEQIFGYMTLFISFVAGISLLVGGIGIMNIMLVSVMERTKEIGIRKALGAKNTSIILQFLAESAILSGIGGLIGMILGMGLANLICLGLGVKVIFHISVVGITTFCACGIGLLFGVHPAKKATYLNPVEALRKE